MAVVDFFLLSGCANVHNCGNDICHLLVAISSVLCLRVPQQPDDFLELRPAALSRFLLAGDVKRNG